MRWYIEAFKKYAVFNGRACRKEYWMFSLFDLIAIVALVIVGLVIHTLIPCYVYTIATTVPTFAVTVRRLHDTSRSAWFALLGFIPMIGGIIILILACIKGDRGQNKYGPDPKQGDNSLYAPLPQY
ncbi:MULTISPECIES: DUF805 domain-containing protein [unclassified Streptomyces]|uniref:DUF805 domain-containing protein n=1 Tax=unclassified Streptomyces TaxID=2593676 RepID=UPI002E2CE32B|nr:DUF805 domain-containing protein [Streptomyces sp. NBC_00223]